MLLFRKSDFLQSRIVTRRFFLGQKLFCLLFKWNAWCVCQVAGISKRSVNFYFWHPMLLIELISISNMGVSLIETCFCSRLYGTCSSFCKEAVPMWYLWLFLFSSCYWNTWKTNMDERKLIVFHKTHTCSSFCKEAVPMWYLWLLLFSSCY